MKLKLKSTLLIILFTLLNNNTLLAANDKNHLNNFRIYVTGWINDEWRKTIEYQKNGFIEIKSQTENTKKKINKIFTHFK